MRWVFGFTILGVPSPWDQSNPSPVLYTDGELSFSGLSDSLSTALSSITSATILPRISGRPGIKFGADPRNPTGDGEEMTIRIKDDAEGTLGTLFLLDDDSPDYGLNTNRVSPDETGGSVTGVPVPESGLYFIERECVEITVVGTTTSATPTTFFQISRGKCGSIAQSHFLRPSRYSAGEDGSEDRIFLNSKPNWEEEFFCEIYSFQLDELSQINSYIKGRGVVVGEPIDAERPFYDIKIRLLEDLLSEHTIGDTSKEITLRHQIIATQIQTGSEDGHLSEKNTKANVIQLLLHCRDAEYFFNEPLAPRGTTALSSTLIQSLNSRMKEDPEIWYEVKIKDGGNDWVYKITALSLYHVQGNQSSAYSRVKITGHLVTGDGAHSKDATIADSLNLDHGNLSFQLRPWWQSNTTDIKSGVTADGDPPTISLRLVLEKTFAQAFVILGASIDGSSNGTFDKIIGGVGAGLPESFFSIGSKNASPLAVLPNTSFLLELEQLNNGVQIYRFDLTQGVSLKEFLANEFIANQVLLCHLQNGLLALKSWLHFEDPVSTLKPLNEAIRPGQRLDSIKRLDLAAGIRIVDLEPTLKRQVRSFTATNIKKEEVQPIKFWRQSLTLSVDEIQNGDLSTLVRAFHKLFGGTPRFYEVRISLQQFIDDGIEEGEQVIWSDANVVTPNGLGISGLFFVIGQDINFDEGMVTLKLLKNSLATTHNLIQAGLLAPMLEILQTTRLSATTVKLVVRQAGGFVLNSGTDFGGLFDLMNEANAFLHVHNFTQAPLTIGTKEKHGSLDSFASMSGLTVNANGEAELTLNVSTGYLRGNITQVEQLFVPGETNILLPPRSPEDTNYDAELIEAHERTSPDNFNYVSFQPREPLNGRLHTFGE